MILGTACLCFGIFSEAATQIGLLSYFDKLPELSTLLTPQQVDLVKKEAWISLALSPVIAFFGIYLFAGGLHIVIKGFWSNPNSQFQYDNTLYLCAQCQLPIIFSVVPIVGPIIASLWVFILLTQALKHFYGISSWLAPFYILIPSLFLKLTWGSALQLIALSL